VTKLNLLTTIAIVALAAATVNAQQPGAPGAGARGIALLDISYIFKNHARFKSMMDGMKGDVKRAENQVKRERDSIRTLAERLREFRSGSPEFKQLEQELAKRQSDLQVQMQLQRKDFLHQEAKIYHTIYREILQEVEYYATSQGISVVLRFSGDPVDIEKPDEVLRDLNKSVVYYSSGLDITPMVLERLNQRSISTSADGRAAPIGVPHRSTR